jgi:hypothetical protein
MLMIISKTKLKYIIARAMSHKIKVCFKQSTLDTRAIHLDLTAFLEMLYETVLIMILR